MQVCVPQPVSPQSQKVSSFLLPQAPRLSVARFDGPCVSRHIHQYFEIVYIETGEGFHSLEGQVAEARAGDIFLISPGEIHDTYGLSEASKWVIAFGADALNSSYTDAVNFLASTEELLLLAFLRPVGVETAHFHVPVADRDHWIERFHLMERELAEKNWGYEDTTRSLLVLLLTDIARLAFHKETALVLPSRRLLARVFRYIDAHFREAISLREVATTVGHSPAYLTDLVRRETGRTVLEWIRERRMAEARYLLRETEQTLQQIAETVGYRHTGHFSNQFKQLHGMTPHTWRTPR